MKLLGGAALLLLQAASLRAASVYVPLREYAGSSFFDGWDYWGDVDNTTWGNVTYLSQPDAVAQKLTYVNSAGNAVVRVDNTTTITTAPLVHRNSIRLTTKDTYGVGTLWMIDAVHLPYGCSVWPSFWSLGVGLVWPNAGEIDIIEGINMMPNNQMALHTTPGCVQAASPGQTGKTLETNCSLDRGCIVGETKPNSFGQSFAKAGGGVWAVQMDVSGVYIWFWSRPDVPAFIKSATSTTNMDPSTWGMPSASYPAANACNITQYFGPQKLVLLTTLCGSWAGVPSIYSQTCPGSCIADNVIGSGSPKYDNAFWEIPYIRTYALQGTTGTTSQSSSQPSNAPTSPSSNLAPASSSTATSSSPNSAVAVAARPTALLTFATLVFLAACRALVRL